MGVAYRAMLTKCAYCGKRFQAGEGWAYRKRPGTTNAHDYFCRYNCMRAWERRPKDNRPAGRRVKCLSTGQVYPSARAAALEVGTEAGNIRAACRGEVNSCAGLRWAWAEDGA